VFWKYQLSRELHTCHYPLYSSHCGWLHKNVGQSYGRAFCLTLKQAIWCGTRIFIFFIDPPLSSKSCQTSHTNSVNRHCPRDYLVVSVESPPLLIHNTYRLFFGLFLLRTMGVPLHLYYSSFYSVEEPFFVTALKSVLVNKHD